MNATWAMIAVLLGILCFILPVVLPTPMPIKTKIGNFYYMLSARMMGRLAFICRKFNQVELFRSKYDNELQCESLNFGRGVIGYFEDVTGLNTSYLFQKTAFLCNDEYSVIFSPLHAEIAEIAAANVREGEHQQVFEVEGQYIAAINPYIKLPRSQGIINVGSIASLVPSSSSPFDPQVIEKMVELSQQGYHKPNLIEMGILLFAYLLSFGATWLGSTYMAQRTIETAGQVTETIPLAVGVFL
jgi:hypothetical protein